MSEQNEFAVTAWGGEGENTKTLTLPSGQRCLVQLLEMEDVIALGVVDQLDTFTGGMLSQALAGETPKKETKKAKKNEAAKWMEALKDQEKFLKLMDAVEKIIIRAVIKPTILPVPDKKADGTAGDRVKGGAYIDRINFNDKMEIFGVVFNNLGDMSSFHKGPATSMGDLEPSEGLPRATIPTTGAVGDQGLLL